MMLLVQSPSTEGLTRSLSFTELISMPDDEPAQTPSDMPSPFDGRPMPLEPQYSPSSSTEPDPTRPASAPLSFYAVRNSSYTSQPTAQTSDAADSDIAPVQHVLDLHRDSLPADRPWTASEDLYSYHDYSGYLLSPLSHSYITSLLEAPGDSEGGPEFASEFEPDPEPGTVAALGEVDERKIFGWVPQDRRPYVVLDYIPDTQEFWTDAQVNNEGVEEADTAVTALISGTVATPLFTPLAAPEDRANTDATPANPIADRSTQSGTSTAVRQPAEPLHISPMWESHLRARLLHDLAQSRASLTPPSLHPPVPSARDLDLALSSAPAPAHAMSPALEMQTSIRRTALSTSPAPEDDPRADGDEPARKKRKHPRPPQGGVHPALARKMASARVAREREDASAKTQMSAQGAVNGPTDGEAAAGDVGWLNVEFASEGGEEGA